MVPDRRIDHGNALSALSYSGIPGEAYYEGYRFLLMPLAVWCALPIMTCVVLPIYHRLQIYSIYEYLELRFDATTRFVSSLLFVVWRLLWLGGVLYAPCKVLLVAAGLQIPMWWLLVILGLVSTGLHLSGRHESGHLDRCDPGSGDGRRPDSW